MGKRKISVYGQFNYCKPKPKEKGIKNKMQILKEMQKKKIKASKQKMIMNLSAAENYDK